MRLRLFLAACALIVVIYWNKGLRRPVERDLRHPPPAPAPKQLAKARSDLMPEQIAILLMRPDQQALAAERTLEPVGVPFMVTLDRKAAFKHRVVFIPFGENAVRMNETLRADLQGFVERGGILVLQAPPENTLSWLTGLASVSPNRKRKKISFRTLADPIFAPLTEPEHQSYLLAAPSSGEGVWTTGLSPRRDSQAVAIADFPETREAAIVRRRLGSGAVYTIGVDLRDMVMRPQAQRHFDAARFPSNAFEPAADVLPLIWRGIYEASTPFWLRLRALPGPEPLWLMTHSIGPGADLAAVREFSILEYSRGIPSTWFVQTRTSPEEDGSPFFDHKMRGLITELRSRGQEIASHGVSHGLNFIELPLGGGETKVSYRPATDDDGFVYYATLLGEATVSRALLEDASATPLGFRGPHALYPVDLDQALEQAGYRYDSSLVANACLTHFPFQMVKSRAMTAASAVIELPVTFADGRSREKPPELGRLLETARRISAQEGLIVWDLFAARAGASRKRLAQVLAAAPSGARWMTMSEAARFWARRSQARFFFRSGSSEKEKILEVSSPDGVGGLSFAASSPIAACKSAVPVSCQGDRLFISEAASAASARVVLTLK